MAREVQPEAFDRMNRVVRIAAEQGLHEVQLLTFSSMYCSDRRTDDQYCRPWPTSTRALRREPTKSSKKSFVHSVISFMRRSLILPEQDAGRRGLCP